jgi:hypothetical protein
MLATVEPSDFPNYDIRVWFWTPEGLDQGWAYVALRGRPEEEAVAEEAKRRNYPEVRIVAKSDVPVPKPDLTDIDDED